MKGESKAGCTSQTTITGTVSCTPIEIVLCNLPDTNSVVGTDIFLYNIVGAINSHTVRPPTCLWASTVLWAPAFTVPDKHGKNPLHASGINSMAGANVCHARRRQHHLPSASDIQQYCGRLPSSCTHRRGQQGLEAYVLSPSHL